MLVIGSQAVHASLRDAIPPEAQRSVEVDVVPVDDSDGLKADLVDGSIGEASAFHESFGIYAQGVSETTAILPQGWRDRLVRYESPATNGVVAWCLDLHDLWLSKAVAGREKDREFCRAMLRAEHVKRAELLERLRLLVDLEPAAAERIESQIQAWSGS
ncbi:MAG: DUF6036 family nucleotidyltransferase [Acidimicrobiia bacterium]